MEVGARRKVVKYKAVLTTFRKWTLRHESRPYGVQQARNLRNWLTPDEGTRSALAMQELLLTANR